MSRERQNSRFKLALIVCLILGEIEAFILMGIGHYFSGTPGSVAVAVFMALLFGVVIGMAQWFMPYAVIVLGVTKLFEQSKEAVDKLGDENVVKSDPDGERKLHEYLTAITSLEARIGLLQRSDPYVPPEQRPPEGATVPRPRLSKLGWNVLSGTVIVGAVAGAVIAARMGVGVVEAEAGEEAIARNTGYIRMFLSSIIGALAAVPVGLVLALVFGKVDTEELEDEEPDDASGSGPETA